MDMIIYCIIVVYIFLVGFTFGRLYRFKMGSKSLIMFTAISIVWPLGLFFIWQSEKLMASAMKGIMTSHRGLPDGWTRS